MLDLKKEYDRYNKLYFGNKLPKDIVVEWSSIIPEEVVASTHVHGVTRCDPRYVPKNCSSSFIRLLPALSAFNNISRCTLLHEMAHVKARLGDSRHASHGPTWQKEMLRLAKAGAFNAVW